MKTLEEVLIRELPDGEYELDDIVKIKNCVLTDMENQGGLLVFHQKRHSNISNTFFLIKQKQWML